MSMCPTKWQSASDANADKGMPPAGNGRGRSLRLCQQVCVMYSSLNSSGGIISTMNPACTSTYSPVCTGSPHTFTAGIECCRGPCMLRTTEGMMRQRLMSSPHSLTKQVVTVSRIPTHEGVLPIVRWSTRIYLSKLWAETDIWCVCRYAIGSGSHLAISSDVGINRSLTQLCARSYSSLVSSFLCFRASMHTRPPKRKVMSGIGMSGCRVGARNNSPPICSNTLVRCLRTCSTSFSRFSTVNLAPVSHLPTICQHSRCALPPGCTRGACRLRLEKLLRTGCPSASRPARPL